MTSLSVLCVSIATPALKRYLFCLKGAVDRMRKRLSEVEVTRCRCKTRLSAMLVREKDHFGNFDDEPRPHAALPGGIMKGSKPRRTWLLALIVCLAVAGCTGAGSVPAQDDQTTSIRSGSDGGDGGGSSM